MSNARKFSPPNTNKVHVPENIFEAFSILNENSHLWVERKENKQVDVAADYLKHRLGLTESQSFLLGGILEESESGPACVDDLSRHFSCSVMRIKSKQKDFDALISKHLINRGFSRSDERVYLVPKAVSLAFEKNEAYHHPEERLERDRDFYNAVDNLFVMRGSGDMGVDQLYDELDSLMQRASHLHFVQEFRRMTLFVPKLEQRLLLYLIVNKEKFGCEETSPNEFKFVFSHEDFRKLVYQKGSDLCLVDKGLATYSNKSHHPMKATYGVTEKVDSTFELVGGGEKEDNPFNLLGKEESAPLGKLVRHKDIEPKELFYNPEEQHQMELLTDLLMPENFNRVQDELAGQGLRGSVNVLLYGGPGTGKTEGVQQLAHKTGRDLYVVDFSQVRDQFVGNSEKNTKRIFEEYREMVKKSDTVPILFINEADGFLGRRFSDPTQSSMRMENTMQNIILQEMETLPGIMICTTNLANNLDPAFERRFIMKLGLNKPSAEVRARIWKSMIPDLTEQQAMALGEEYELAGGNLENVARKRTMEKVLYGKEITLERLKELCNEELVGNTRKSTKKIGF